MSRNDLSCREVLDFLAAYLEGELDAKVHADFEHHLLLCRPCVQYLEEYRETICLGRLAYELDDPVREEIPEELVAIILASERSGRRS